MTYYEDLYFPAPCEIQSLYNRGWTVNRLSKLCYDMLPECEQKKDHSAMIRSRPLTRWRWCMGAGNMASGRQFVPSAALRDTWIITLAERLLARTAGQGWTEAMRHDQR